MFNSFWKNHGTKIISIAKGAGIAAIGAGVTFALPYISAIQYATPGEAIAAAAAISIIINALRKFGVPVITGTPDNV